jgi:pimeloyl-ACP methyl ester carboxylesterase
MHEGLAIELDGLFQCVRYQQRGLEPSDAPGPYSVHIFVTDAIAVLDALGWERATLIGHSWGGLLAQHITAAHPERVDALIGLSTLGSAGPDGGWSDLDAEFAKRIPPEAEAMVTELDQKLYRGEGRDQDIVEMLNVTWPFYFSDPASAPPMPLAPSSQEVYSQVHADTLRLFNEGTLERKLRELDTPALFLTGADDPASPEHPRKTAETMPRGAFVLLNGCGHFPWLERPGATRAAIEGWLAQLA